MGKEKKVNEFNESDFIVAAYTRAKDGRLCYRSATFLKNDETGIIKTDGNIILITDQKGKVLYEINRKGNDIEKEVTEIKYDKVSDDKIVFTLYHGEKALKTVYINNDRKNRMQRDLFDISKGGELVSIETPNPKKNTIVLNRKSRKRTEAILFSMDKGRFISPSFTRFEKTENEDILKFEDLIESDVCKDKRRYNTLITGFISLDGQMANTVYDDDMNQTREIGLKAGKLMEGYKKFRLRVKGELDYMFEVEYQNKKRKQSYENKSIAQLNLRVQRNK